MNRWSTTRFLALGFFCLALPLAIIGGPAADERRRWERGRGWGWIWGPDDEVGALNALGPQQVVAALRLAQKGRVHDLGLTYDRTSFRAGVHNPGEIISFRSPEGLKRGKDLVFHRGSGAISEAWHSNALFLNDNIATQIDGLAHITTDSDNHWYNGFKEADWGGDFGPRKASADKIPPIIAQGVLIDVAGWKKGAHLPSHYRITPADLQATLAWQRSDIRVNDVVLIRTGTAGLWGETGSDLAKIAAADSAGIDLDAAKWLVAEKGAILVGSDTSALEWLPKDAAIGIGVHRYLLIEQGVLIGELHNLERLARDRVYRFAYIATTNKLKGSVAGFALRPLAID